MTRLIKRHELKDFIGKEIYYQNWGCSFEKGGSVEIIFSISSEYITYDTMLYDFLDEYGLTFRFWTGKPTKEQWDNSNEPID